MGVGRDRKKTKGQDVMERPTRKWKRTAHVHKSMGKIGNGRWEMLRMYKFSHYPSLSRIRPMQFQMPTLPGIVTMEVSNDL